MKEQPEFEPTQEIEDALRRLYHQNGPAPAFVDRLERQLLARSQAEPAPIPWYRRLRVTFSSTARTLAWGTLAILFVVMLGWSIRYLIPSLEPLESRQALQITPEEKRFLNGVPLATSTSLPVLEPAAHTPAPTPTFPISMASPFASLPSVEVEQPAVKIAAGKLGKLAYVKDGDIWVKPIPGDTSSRLTTDGSNHQPRWSPSGNWLAFRKGADQVWVAGSGGSNAYPLDANVVINEFAWAPEQDLLAYTTGTGELRILDLAARQTRVLYTTRSTWSIFRLAWNPEGDWIAFDGMERRPAQVLPAAGLWKILAAGGEPVELYDEAATLAGWTGDGRFVVAWKGSVEHSASQLTYGALLALVPSDGGEPQMIRNSVMLYPDYVRPNVNGRGSLAVVVGSGRAAWMNKALSILTNEKIARPVLPGWVVSSPAWSPDGGRIAYVGMPELKDETAKKPLQQALMGRRIWVVDMKAGQPLKLVDDPAFRDEYPLWSADGSKLLFVRMDAQNRVSLWLIPAQGGEPKLMHEGLSTADLMTPDAGWFGDYGHMDWYNLFDWWQ